MKAAERKYIFSAEASHEALERLFKSSFDFHDKNSIYGGHNFHAFAAKFPPQLPRIFIEELISEREVVLDPMMGSGTTIVEALLSGRRAVGCDIDPLAVKITRVKTSNYNAQELMRSANDLISSAYTFSWDQRKIETELSSRFSGKTREFLDYWFLPQTQKELMALILAIEEENSPLLREFFEVVFSSIIVTKSGGVSRARDLAHTRPHLHKEKKPKEALAQFQQKAKKMIQATAERPAFPVAAQIHHSDARNLPLPDESVDLIVTSPPYANAIDYMRAHKFSLVWLGEKVEALSRHRSIYIGSETLHNKDMKELPGPIQSILEKLTPLDARKAKVLRQYYLDMAKAISEMKRVLKTGRAALIVIGASTMRGIDVQTHIGLAELAKAVGFKLVGIKERKLDRNRRMMPARSQLGDSQIENRMYSEYIIGLIKPARTQRFLPPRKTIPSIRAL